VAGVAQLGVREIHEARDGRAARDLRPAVVDRVHDGPGKLHQSAVRRLPNGPVRPEESDRRARSVVHHLLVTDAVRAQYGGPVHGQADGWSGQRRFVHGGAGVPGRDCGRGHPRRAGQRVHHTAQRRRAVRSDHWPVRVLPNAQRHVCRGAHAVLYRFHLGARVAVLPAQSGPAGRRGPVPALVQRL